MVGELEYVALSDMWKHEALDFTKWPFRTSAA